MNRLGEDAYGYHWDARRQEWWGVMDLEVQKGGKQDVGSGVINKASHPVV